MATIEAVELPTKKEYAAVWRTVEDAYNAVERLVWQLNKIDEDVQLSRPATLADVGAAWSFFSHLRNRASDLGDYAKTLEDAIDRLDIAREEAQPDEAA